jgi:hypothetical protein
MPIDSRSFPEIMDAEAVRQRQFRAPHADLLEGLSNLAAEAKYLFATEGPDFARLPDSPGMIETVECCRLLNRLAQIAAICQRIAEDKSLCHVKMRP